MRKLAASTLAIAALAPVLGASAQTPVTRAKATVVRCVPALDQTQRFGVFQGEMHAVKGANRMQMRFTVLQQLPGEQFKPVTGTGLDLWNTSRANVAIYRFRKRVENLIAPAAYRTLISFRWLGPKGRVVRNATRLSPICHQPDLRPNLKPGHVGGKGAGKQRAAYTVAVRNFGRTPASNFDVVLQVNGADQPVQNVAFIAKGGGRQVVKLTAPRCKPGTNLVATIDPDNRVAETNESDNQLVVACPLA
jgi:hypothetical protein